MERCQKYAETLRQEGFEVREVYGGWDSHGLLAMKDEEIRSFWHNPRTGQSWGKNGPDASRRTQELYERLKPKSEKTD